MIINQLITIMLTFHKKHSEIYDSPPDERFLSSPEPKFTHGGWNFSNALKIHWLLITGNEEEVLRRRGGLTTRLLSTTCEYESRTNVRLSVSQVSDKNFQQYC